MLNSQFAEGQSVEYIIGHEYDIYDEELQQALMKSMNESMEDMKRETDDLKKQQLIKENRAKIYKLNMKHSTQHIDDGKEADGTHISIEGMNILESSSKLLIHNLHRD